MSNSELTNECVLGSGGNQLSLDVPSLPDTGAAAGRMGSAELVDRARRDLRHRADPWGADVTPLRRMAQAWMRFETTGWADALGAAALFATLAAGLFLVLGCGGWGPLG